MSQQPFPPYIGTATSLLTLPGSFCDSVPTSALIIKEAAHQEGAPAQETPWGGRADTPPPASDGSSAHPEEVQGFGVDQGSFRVITGLSLKRELLLRPETGLAAGEMCCGLLPIPRAPEAGCNPPPPLNMPQLHSLFFELLQVPTVGWGS